MEGVGDEREAPCGVHGQCGGCDWMQATELTQNNLRRRRVQGAVDGAVSNKQRVEVRLVSGEQALGYRCRARFQVSHPAHGPPCIGFAGRGAFHQVVDAPDCLVLSAALRTTFHEVRDFVHKHLSQAEASLPSHHPSRISGVEIVRFCEDGATASVTLNPRDRAPEPWPDVGLALIAHCPTVCAVCVQLSKGDERPRRIGAEFIVGRTPRNNHPIAYAVGGFVQSNLWMVDSLTDEVCRLSLAGEGRRIAELHAGSGLLSWAMAAAGAHVFAVELNHGSVAAARALPPPPRGQLTIEQHNANNFFTDPVFDHLRDIDTLVIDPPRSGLGPLAREIAALGPHRFVGVWCSVPSMARDLQVLVEGGYEMVEAVAVDLFPQTSHVETILCLQRCTPKP